MAVSEWLDISWEYHHGGITAESSAKASALKGNIGSTNLKRNIDSFARVWEESIKTPYDLPISESFILYVFSSE